MPIPDFIPINLMDDLHTAYVGECENGHQFFLADHNVPRRKPDKGCVGYLALYLFDRDGLPVNADIRKIPGYEFEEEIRSTLLEQIGRYDLHDIAVAPFQFNYDGLIFGLIPDSEKETLTLEPGSMIMFMEPWDGEYYT